MNARTYDVECSDCGQAYGADRPRRHEPWHRRCPACLERRAQPVTVTLRREDAQTLYELGVSRAVVVESSEEQAHTGFNSPQFRRPATVMRRALDA